MSGQAGPASFEYLPDQRSLLEVCTPVSPQRVLLVGGDELVNLPADETRKPELPGPVMGYRTYVIQRARSVDVVVCSGGTVPGMRLVASVEELADGHPLPARHLSHCGV